MQRRELVSIWVGAKSKVPSLRSECEREIADDTDAATARRRARKPARHRTGMDITWLTTDGFTTRNDVSPGSKSKVNRIGVGGGIWNSYNMADVAKQGITHIINMQIEFPRDGELADEHSAGGGRRIEVLWNPTDDDFEFKPASLFRGGVEFAEKALEDPKSKLFIHCAAGVHRAPMMALAVLGAMGWDVDEAMELIEARRPVADFADVYVKSVRKFLGEIGE